MVRRENMVHDWPLLVKIHYFQVLECKVITGKLHMEWSNIGPNVSHDNYLEAFSNWQAKG